jgi:hypothetical protein
MTTQNDDIANKELHAQAESLARSHVNRFAVSLIMQAKLLAYKRRDDLVLSNHIEEALEVIYKERETRWSRELIIVVGSTLFGAFVPGFITELSTGRTAFIIIYTVLGFLGILLVFIGLRR